MEVDVESSTNESGDASLPLPSRIKRWLLIDDLRKFEVDGWIHFDSDMSKCFKFRRSVAMREIIAAANELRSIGLLEMVMATNLRGKFRRITLNKIQKNLELAVVINEMADHLQFDLEDYAVGLQGLKNHFSHFNKNVLRLRQKKRCCNDRQKQQARKHTHRQQNAQA